MKLSMSRLSNRAFYLQCSVYLFFIYISLSFNSFFLSLDSEAGPVELIGAFALLTTSIILFRSIKFTNKFSYHFWMLLIASMAFFWAWGEELSWGQHMFGTNTPDWLKAINGQNETNLHNINKKFFDRTLERLTVLLTLITAFQHFRGKEFFAKFRLPEYPLNMAFMLIPIYRKLQSFDNDVWHMCFIMFLGYPIYALIKKNYRMLIYSIIFIMMTLLIIYVHHSNIHLFGGKSNYFHEIREMMFSIICIFFSIQIHTDLKRTKVL